MFSRKSYRVKRYRDFVIIFIGNPREFIDIRGFGEVAEYKSTHSNQYHFSMSEITSYNKKILLIVTKKL